MTKTKKTIDFNTTATNSSFETSKIQFGKIDIVVNSVNTVPNIISFYDSMPLIAQEHMSRHSLLASKMFHASTPTKTNNKNQEKIDNNNNDNSIISECIHEKKHDEHDTVTTITCRNNDDLVYCWWCKIHVMRKEESCFLPWKYNEYRDIHEKIGYFCCWECVKAYNFDMKDNKMSFRQYLINNVCRRLYGIEQSRSIKYSRHWSELKRFGGHIPDHQFFTIRETATLSKAGKSRSSIR